VFVVTGGTQGVGKEIALFLADAGAHGVVFCGRNRNRGEDAVRELGERGSAGVFVAADLSREADCRAVIAACDERFGRVHGLVNAAGLTDRGDIETTTVELWDRLFAVNLRAPFILCQETVRVMRREGIKGSIVNVSSMSSHGGQPFLLPYSTTKGALNVFTKNLAHAVRGDGIRVNSVNLGWTETPGEHAIQRKEGAPPDWLERAEKEQPFGRLIKPYDLAYMATFLLSDEAAMVTGALIDLDQNVMGAYD